VPDTLARFCPQFDTEAISSTLVTVTPRGRHFLQWINM